MPAQSKSQQRFFGVVKAMQKGDIPKKGKAGKIAKQMSKGDVDDFASTKHKGKPEKVKREQRVKNLIKKMVREELAKMNEGSRGPCWKGYTQKGMKKKGDRMVPNCVKNEEKLNEKTKVQRYVVGLDNGEVISGDKSVTEKRALQIMSRISKRSDGWVNPFMIGVEAWNGTHEKSKGKPHKMNKKKIMVKEGTCGYGVNGQLGEEPAGPHLIKKKMKEEVEPIGGMAKIAKIVKDKQHAKVGGQTVDMQSANLLMKLYNAVKDKDKEKMNKMSEKKLIMVLSKLWSRVKLKLPV